jgi:hypothetical protein
VASIYTRQGRTSAKVDSGAFSIWVDSEVYKHISDVPIESGGEACSADGSDLLVVGSGRIQFSLWGRRFDAKVRIMSHLPSGILIGRRFLMKHAMGIDFGRLTGSFMQNVQGKPVRFSGKIMLDDCEQVEISAVVEEADVESEIRALLSDLGDEAENMRQVLLKHQDEFKGLGLAKGEEFKIQLTEGFDIDKLDCPPRRRSEKERLLEEIEVQKMLDLGVLAPSSAAASTNNVFVNKKTTNSAGNTHSYGPSAPEHLHQERLLPDAIDRRNRELALNEKVFFDTGSQEWVLGSRA